MPYTDWPVIENIQEQLTGCGINPIPSDALITQKLKRAIADLHELTGWKPFFNPAASVISTRKFLYPVNRGYEKRGFEVIAGDNVLDLEGGLLATPTVSIAGNDLVFGQQFYMLPEDALRSDADGDFNAPYQAIEFLPTFSVTTVGVYGPAQQYALVTGAWGYCAAIPDEVWDAVIDRTCYLLMPIISANRTDGTVMRISGATMERFAIGRGTAVTTPGGVQGSGAYAFESEEWNNSWNAVVELHTRLPIGV